MARKRRCGSSPNPTSAACNTGLELPDELILDILLRLPAKSLFRLRCVCKSWDERFVDPHFLKQHSNSPYRKSAHCKFMMKTTNWIDPRPLQSFGVPTLCRDKSPADSQYLRLPIDDHCPSIVCPSIVGCCNGVFCLRVRQCGQFGTILFWNPLTDQCIILPYTFSMYYQRVGGDSVSHENVLGFGFDEYTNEFKLVRIFVDFSSKPAKRAVEVYGMWEGCRKRISDFPYGRPYMSHISMSRGVWVNGALHWVSSVQGEENKITSPIIAALDIAKETFRRVFLPDQVANEVVVVEWDEEYDITLYCVGELLCLMRSCHGDVDVWIMKKYGVKESWIKLLTIPFMSLSSMNPKFPSFPLYYSEINDELLMICRGQLVLYNSKDHSIEGVGISRVFKSYYCDAEMCNTYIESLFTPSVMKRLRGESNQKHKRFRRESDDPKTGVATWSSKSLRRTRTIMKYK